MGWSRVVVLVAWRRTEGLRVRLEMRGKWRIDNWVSLMPVMWMETVSWSVEALLNIPS